MSGLRLGLQLALVASVREHVTPAFGLEPDDEARNGLERFRAGGLVIGVRQGAPTVSTAATIGGGCLDGLGGASQREDRN